MKFQYLAVTNKTNCICEDHFAFNRLLLVNSKIKIFGKNLLYTDENLKIETEYAIHSGCISDLSQFFLNISITLCSNTKSVCEIDIDKLNIIRKIIFANLKQLNSKVSINTLWDDISLYYSCKAYPFIAKIENLMRKFIMEQMFLKFGSEWYEQRMPNEVKDQISKKKDFNKALLFENPLYEADFIHLSQFFFKQYRLADLQKLDNYIRNKKSREDIDMKVLQSFISESNWDRFFSSQLRNIDEKYLSKKWEQLYVLRIKIAHNKDFSKTDFNDVLSLTSDLEEKIFSKLESNPNFEQIYDLELSVQENKNSDILYSMFLNKSNYDRKDLVLTDLDYQFSPKIIKTFNSLLISNLGDLIKNKNEIMQKLSESEKAEIDDFIIING